MSALTSALPAYRAETGIDYLTYSEYELDASDPFAGGAAYVDGEFVPLLDARIPLYDQGFLHSHLTYTVFHVWNGQAFRVEDHLDRLLANAAAIRLESPISRDELRAASLEMVARSGLREAYVNITITGGFADGDPGQRRWALHRPRVYMYAVPYLFVPGFDGIRDGMRATVVRGVRRSPRNVIDPQVKNFQWGDLIRASQEAGDKGYPAAILLDGDGLVAEGPGFNVAIIRGGELLTPERNALPGITRKTLLEIAEERGLTARTADITEADLYGADEVLGCTTAGGIWPFVSIDETIIGDGTPGRHTRAIIERYWELCVEPSSLLTPVDYR
ncbi:aminotransferase class IV [Microbacterium sp. NPDC091313]